MINKEELVNALLELKKLDEDLKERMHKGEVGMTEYTLIKMKRKKIVKALKRKDVNKNR